ncbi:MAG: hypothetical protein HZB26_02975 [Candidatus Hydrogenedentes bacterium]|nr:hypothetical protein [Candidatus Hydrogenedentota bacterium]
MSEFIREASNDMSDAERLERNSEWETIRFFAVACILVAGLILAYDAALVVETYVSSSNGIGPKTDAVLVALAPLSAWDAVRITLLLVMGVGLLWRRRWEWWLALGSSSTMLVLAISESYYRYRFYPEPPFLVTLVVFLLLPSMRTAFRRSDDLKEMVATGNRVDGVANEVRAMGWLVLLTALKAPNAVFILVQLASEPSGLQTPVGWDERLKAILVADVVMGAAAAAAGFGMILRRSWARRTALFFGVIVILGYGLNWYMSVKYPSDWAQGVPSNGPVARGAN